jgi:hypothetical protein
MSVVWERVPRFRTVCGLGVGLAACRQLGILVTSDTGGDVLDVHALPGSLSDVVDEAGLTHVCSLRGADLQPPVKLKLGDAENDPSGYLAFAEARDGYPPLLLITAPLHSSVHVVDVLGRRHLGFVGGRGTICTPRGVATHGSLVAVCNWEMYGRGDHVVVLFEGAGGAWTVLRTVGYRYGGSPGQLRRPMGLRFSAGGSRVVVASNQYQCVSEFLVADGTFVRDIARGVQDVYDVEEWGGGWLVAGGHVVEFVSGGDAGKAGPGPRTPARTTVRYPSALVWVPGFGLVARDGVYGDLHVVAPADDVAMANMSAGRVAWMAFCVRGARAVVQSQAGSVF